MVDKETSFITKISVVIPTYNRPDMLAETLCLLEQMKSDSHGIDFEVVVSDDSPGDETKNRIESDFPWVKWIKGPQKGPAANRNCGVKNSSGSWIVFTDDDCLPQPGWLEAFVRKIRHDLPTNCVLEGKTTADREQQRLDEESPINTTGGYLWSCNMAISRTDFEAIGGFNEDFPYPAMEDVEFREHLLHKGYQLVFCEDALVIHPWRTCKGPEHLKRELESWHFLNQLHPHQAPSSLWKYFVHRSIRTFIKVTIPKGFRYRFRGFFHAVRVDAFYFCQGIRHFIKGE